MQAKSEDIATFLDVENSITVRWLSNTLGLSMDESRTALDQYCKSHPAIGVSYLISGENQSGSLSFIVASGEDVVAAKKTLKTVHNEQIYAVHKILADGNRAELESLELGQGSELLMMQHPNSPVFLKNSNGYIRCPDIEVKPIGQRILSSSYAPAEPATSATQIVKSTLSKPVVEAIAPTAAPAVLKSKSSIQVSNFFGATAVKKEKPAEATPVGKQETSPSTVSQTSVPTSVKEEPSSASAEEKAAPAKRVGRVIADDEDEEWDSGYKPDPARLKQRVDPTAAARMTISVGATEDVEDMDATAAAEDEAAQEDSAKSAGGKRKGKAPVMVHGAMDDYFEDIAIAEHNRAEANPAGAAPKPKRRRLVEKVLLDLTHFLIYSCLVKSVHLFLLAFLASLADVCGREGLPGDLHGGGGGDRRRGRGRRCHQPRRRPARQGAGERQQGERRRLCCEPREESRPRGDGCEAQEGCRGAQGWAAEEHDVVLRQEGVNRRSAGGVL